KEGTLLDAGTTGSGEPLQYALESEYIITQASIARMMADLSDENFSGETIIYTTEDATAVAGVGEGWRPFGASQQSLSEEMRQMVPASLGCAVASPNFLLAEGTRTVTLKFALVANDPSSLVAEYPGIVSAIDIHMTSEEGWASPDKIVNAQLKQNTSGSAEYTLTVTVEYGQSAVAIVGYDESIHAQQLKTSWPVWRM